MILCHLNDKEINIEEVCNKLPTSVQITKPRARNSNNFAIDGSFWSM